MESQCGHSHMSVVGGASSTGRGMWRLMGGPEGKKKAPSQKWLGAFNWRQAVGQGGVLSATKLTGDRVGLELLFDVFCSRIGSCVHVGNGFFI